ncbi:MAG: hypothetical protein IAE80_11475 [Anaerolinea sp.]|nr:hypothetical protein [Anaerolinea sp.]
MIKRLLLLSLAAFALAACELQAIPGGQTPSVQPTIATEIQSPSPSPTLTASAEPQLEPPTATPTPEPPTETATFTETPNPYATYILQQGDTLIYIVQLFGHRDLAVIDEVIRLNPNITSEDRLPGAGSSITIPLPTATFTPEGFALTASAQPPVIGSGVRLPVDTEIIQVPVAEGITILGIAGEYNTTLLIMATLNPQLGFFNCDFTNPSGGPDCNVPLSIGDLVNVPALTPTPTLSPTFSGNETATPTPTYMPPIAFFPQQDAVISPVSFSLQWASVGVLHGNERYLVEVQDTVTGVQFLEVTQNTSFRLPESLIPSDGQPHIMRWRISVAVPNEQGAYRIISAGSYRTFTWQSH